MDDSEADFTLYCGNLSDRVTEDILYELFLQAGPVRKVKIPKDRENNRQQSFGFITFKHEASVDYAINLFRETYLFGKSLNLQPRQASHKQQQLLQLQQLQQQQTWSSQQQMKHMLPKTQSNRQQQQFYQQQAHDPPYCDNDNGNGFYNQGHSNRNQNEAKHNNYDQHRNYEQHRNLNRYHDDYRHNQARRGRNEESKPYYNNKHSNKPSGGNRRRHR